MKTAERPTTRRTRRIRPSKRRARRVDPSRLAQALGGEVVASAPNLRGSTPAMLAARAELFARLRSTGGRPGLAGATKRRQVSFTPKDWQELERIAETIEEREGVKTTPGQVASALIHNALAKRK